MVRGIRVFLVLVVCCLVLAPGASAQVEVHVSATHPSASDNNPGTLEAPLRTLSKAMQRALANKRNRQSTRVVVHPGTYRETVSYGGTNWPSNDPSNTTPITVEAIEPGTAVISGSEVFAQWQREGAHYVHAWPYDWGVSENPWKDYRQLPEIVLRREVVFVDGVWMRPVLTAGELVPGTFYVDEVGDRLYLYPSAGVDMSRALVEVAVRDRLWKQEYEHNVTVRGLVFQHASTPWRDGIGAFSCSGCSGLTLEDVRLHWNNWTGLFLADAENIALRRVVMNHNGANGWGTWRVKNLLAEDTETSYNNWRGALGSFGGWAVGNKVEAVHGLVIRRHRAVQNQSRGLWLDYDIEDALLEELYLAENRGDGLWIEAAPGPVLLRRSTIRNNGGSGLLSTYSEGVTVEENLFCENARGQLQFSGEGGRKVRNFETRTSEKRFLQGWTLRANTFVGGEVLLKADENLSAPAWERFRRTLTSDRNVWVHAVGVRAFAVGGRHYALAAWQEQTGQDRSSKSAGAGGGTCGEWARKR